MIGHQRLMAQWKLLQRTSVSWEVKMIKVLKLLILMLLIKFWRMTITKMEHPLTTRVVQEGDNRNLFLRGAKSQDSVPGLIRSPNRIKRSKRNRIWHWISSDHRKQQKEEKRRLVNSSRWKLEPEASLIHRKVNKLLIHPLQFWLRMLEHLYLSKVKRKRKCSLKVVKSTFRFSLWLEWASLRVFTK